MAFQRRTFGTIVNDTTAGSTGWTNPSNAASSDNSYAVASALTPSGTSQYLKATNSSYLDGSVLNTGDTINFISWSVERYKSGNPSANIRDWRLYAVEGGVIVSANNYADTATDWGTTDTDTATGHTQNMNLPTAATILASDWGFLLAAQNTNATSGGTANVDWMYAYIDFTGTVTAALTGTAIETSSSVLRESQVVAGGKTIIITLTGDTWVASGATFDAQRQNIINGLDSDGAAAHGWDAEVKANLAVTTVVRTSNTVVTVTLSAQAAYDISAMETITCTVPSSALTGAGGAVTATPTFRCVPDFGRITHLGGLGIGLDVPPRKLCVPRAGIVPGHWKDVRPR